jgi:hypothetical protein
MERIFEVFKIDTEKFKSLCIVDSEKVKNGENAVIAYMNLGSDKAEISSKHFADANLLAASAEMAQILKALIKTVDLYVTEAPIQLEVKIKESKKLIKRLENGI